MKTLAAWDGGAVTSLQVSRGQKTVQTVCGRRVRPSRILNDRPSCAGCRAILLERQREARLVAEALRA